MENNTRTCSSCDTPSMTSSAGNSSDEDTYVAVNVTENADKTAHRKHVINKILKNFRLEDTLDKYRNMSAASYRMNPADFSLDCSFPVQQIRNRLVHLTGSDVIMVNNGKYMDRLRLSIWDEYQRKLDAAEHKRQEEEKDRLRRLLERGLVSPDTLLAEYQYKVSRKRLPGSGSARGRQLQSPTRRKRRATGVRSAPVGRQRENSPNSPFVRSIGRTSYSASGKDLWWRQMSVNAANGEETTQRRQSLFTPLDDKKDPHKSDDDTDDPLQIHHYEHPLVVEMRNEETVDGLYDLADQLIAVNIKCD